MNVNLIGSIEILLPLLKLLIPSFKVVGVTWPDLQRESVLC